MVLWEGGCFVVSYVQWWRDICTENGALRPDWDECCCTAVENVEDVENVENVAVVSWQQHS